jgi:cytoplasmic iron level regulating protein YaaA (DUF328/UPF0246 family)
MNAVHKKTINKTTTIDEKHTEMLNKFNLDEIETLPKLIEEIENLKTQMKGLNDNQIDQYMDIRDKIESCKKKIKETKKQKKL